MKRAFILLLVGTLLTLRLPPNSSAQLQRVPAWQVSAMNVYWPANTQGWVNLSLSTNASLQEVLDWIDQNWPNATNILLNTNSWSFLSPNTGTIQGVFDWIEANPWTTNAYAINVTNGGFSVLQGSNVQQVFDWLDDNFATNASQIAVATNSWDTIAPSNRQVQAALDSIDNLLAALNALTNGVASNQLPRYVDVGRTKAAGTYQFVVDGDLTQSRVISNIAASVLSAENNFLTIQSVATDVSTLTFTNAGLYLVSLQIGVTNWGGSALMAAGSPPGTLVFGMSRDLGASRAQEITVNLLGTGGNASAGEVAWQQYELTRIMRFAYTNTLTFTYGADLLPPQTCRIHTVSAHITRLAP